MIRPININLNAAHPELPLVEATTFVGAPSSVFIRGVPKAVGNWSITAVSVAVTYPDNTTTARAAVESAEGVWVATIPGTATSGRTAAGFKIVADGIDENGAAVTGYVLGFADFSVLSFTPVPAPGGTFYLLRYFDQAPATPKEGDVAKIDGVLKFYNGSAWEPFVTFDDAVTRTSANGVKSSGIWSAIWGALAALPTGFSSLYDWCVAQFTGKFAQYYPDGSVKSTAEFTAGIKYDDPDTTNRTITVKPFCNTGDSANDNSGLVGRVVIPPFVDASGNGYISDDGTRYKVVGVSGGNVIGVNYNLTDVIAPTTVTTLRFSAFAKCAALTSVSLPAAESIWNGAFKQCAALTSVSLPAAESIGKDAFVQCDALTSVAIPSAMSIDDYAFEECTLLSAVDFGDTPRPSVPSLGTDAFSGVPSSCKIIVPYTQYDAWKAESGWSSLPQEFVRHAEKADKPATFTTGNLAKFDSSGNPVDSEKKPGDFQSALSAQQLANIAAVSAALAFDATHTYEAGDPVVYNCTLYTFTAAHTGAWTGSDVSAVDIIARLAGKLDKSGGTVTGDILLGNSNIALSPTGEVVVDYGAAGEGRLIFPLVPGKTTRLADILDIAPTFSTSSTYAQNALCVHEHVLYRCTTAVTTAGAWTGVTNWAPLATVEDVLAALRTGKANRAANPTTGNLAALDANGNPTDSGVKPSDKLDSTSAAPAFSTSSTYAVDERVTYNGKLYRCTTAVTTAGAWDASKWTEDTMTDPDAVLDVTAQNQLRVVAKDGTLLWAQGYDLASTSSATLACDATNNFTFADGATTQAFALPTAPTGKVGDFGLDIDNSANTGAATMTLTGLDSTFSIVVPKGESLTDMLSIAAGELARFYITLSTFRVNNLPTWHIVKQIVENGGAQS